MLWPNAWITPDHLGFFQHLATGFSPYPSGSLTAQAAGCPLGSLCPFQRGFTLLLGCGSVSSCQSPLHLSFAGQRKAPGRNHHLLSCESHSAGCNPSLPGRKNSEWPYKKGKAFPQEGTLQAEAVRAGEENFWFMSFVSLGQNTWLEISVPSALSSCECCRCMEVCVSRKQPSPTAPTVL